MTPIWSLGLPASGIQSALLQATWLIPPRLPSLSRSVWSLFPLPSSLPSPACGRLSKNLHFGSPIRLESEWKYGNSPREARQLDRSVHRLNCDGAQSAGASNSCGLPQPDHRPAALSHAVPVTAANLGPSVSGDIRCSIEAVGFTGWLFHGFTNQKSRDKF